jgi:hypothetical protein
MLPWGPVFGQDFLAQVWLASGNAHESPQRVFSQAYLACGFAIRVRIRALNCKPQLEEIVGVCLTR